MSEARIIKRYANRKLYDTQHSRYVTLEQIAEMIRHGDDVKIIDNKSKDDLTSVTLAQIIFEEEKKQKSFLPLQAMRNIIETGGESITQFVSHAQRRMTNILPRKGHDDELGDEGELEAVGDEELSGDPAADDDGARGKAREGISTLREFREWILHSQQMIDEWQKKVDGRIRHVVEGISPLAPLTSLQRDVQGLASRIAELEQKLSQIAARRREQNAGAAQAEPEPKPEREPVAADADDGGDT